MSQPQKSWPLHQRIANLRWLILLAIFVLIAFGAGYAISFGIAIRQSNWLTGSIIFFMPILLIFFLGSQMAYSHVKGKFDAYQGIPEVTRPIPTL